jgi:hypothetical protein
LSGGVAAAADDEGRVGERLFGAEPATLSDPFARRPAILAGG